MSDAVRRHLWEGEAWTEVWKVANQEENKGKMFPIEEQKPRDEENRAWFARETLSAMAEESAKVNCREKVTFLSTQDSLNCCGVKLRIAARGQTRSQNASEDAQAQCPLH